MEVYTVIKRVLMLFVVLQILSFCIIISFATDAVIFKVGTTIVSKNDQKAEVTISITNNVGFAAADIIILSELGIDSIDDLGINAVSNCQNGKVNWSRAKNSYTTGDILKVTFVIPPGVKDGDFWDVDLIVTEIINEDLVPVSCSVIKGRISISNTESIYNNYGDQLKMNYKQNNIKFLAYSSNTDECVDASWTSSNEKVATINESGFVTTKSIGTTVITSTNKNNVIATTKLTVKYSFLQWLIIILIFGWIWY